MNNMQACQPAQSATCTDTYCYREKQKQNMTIRNLLLQCIKMTVPKLLPTPPTIFSMKKDMTAYQFNKLKNFKGQTPAFNTYSDVFTIYSV